MIIFNRSFYHYCDAKGNTLTLLNFGTKCEGEFVPDSPTIHVATEHVQCTVSSGLGWWEK